MNLMHRRSSLLLPTLFIICLLILFSSSFDQGYGRELELKDIVKSRDVHQKLLEEIVKLKREIIEVMDYYEPGANTNNKNGLLITPPPRPRPPPPPAAPPRA